MGITLPRILPIACQKVSVPWRNLSNLQDSVWILRVFFIKTVHCTSLQQKNATKSIVPFDSQQQCEENDKNRIIYGEWLLLPVSRILTIPGCKPFAALLQQEMKGISQKVQRMRISRGRYHGRQHWENCFKLQTVFYNIMCNFIP